MNIENVIGRTTKRPLLELNESNLLDFESWNSWKIDEVMKGKHKHIFQKIGIDSISSY